MFAFERLYKQLPPNAAVGTYTEPAVFKYTAIFTVYLRVLLTCLRILIHDYSVCGRYPGHVHGHVLSVHKGVRGMASSQAADETDTSTAGVMGSKVASEMEELRRVQIANEGMNLLLCSRLKEAEDLFRKSRLVARQLDGFGREGK